ncbi:hypothetical protein PV327_006220 [Microctonus hyperodae]|uniref:Uncharacterized protein n=1 Tax=Microctonus hyperodae TaxID=165561 RepID=A0AA39KHW5_MICHY|nr:hypothetical protein PV327_006220 [Microctonus hyperodae]
MSFLMGMNKIIMQSEHMEYILVVRKSPDTSRLKEKIKNDEIILRYQSLLKHKRYTMKEFLSVRFPQHDEYRSHCKNEELEEFGVNNKSDDTLFTFNDKEKEPTCLRSIKAHGHHTDVRTVCFSSDNIAIATASGNSIELWNGSLLACLRIIECGLWIRINCSICSG